MLLSNEVDVVFFKNIRSAHTIQVVVQDQDTRCLFLHERPIENFLVLLSRPFTDLAWVLIASVAVLCLVLGHFYVKYFPRNLLLMAFFGIPLPCHRLARSERIVLLMLNLLLLILSSAYITKMLEIMYSVKYKPHIQTIREFGQSGMVVYSVYAAEREQIQNVYPSWRLADVVSSETIPEDSAMPIRCVVVELYLQSRFNLDPHTEMRKFYVVREPLFWDAITHSFAKSNPLVERFVQVWDRLYEAGIVQRLVREFKNENRDERNVFVDSLLQFNDLILMWWILAYGFGASAKVQVKPAKYHE
ncbi:AAEL008712-PA [Aedes aegypti]|uniref:AAEL008712-PA n=1 Tax=Aedes aegypti TaxID=7159 RepID=Q16Y02_AEDAE|nr:AAEL008712-PA [Aedes aegypti]